MVPSRWRTPATTSPTTGRRAAVRPALADAEALIAERTSGTCGCCWPSCHHTRSTRSRRAWHGTVLGFAAGGTSSGPPRTDWRASAQRLGLPLRRPGLDPLARPDGRPGECTCTCSPGGPTEGTRRCAPTSPTLRFWSTGVAASIACASWIKEPGLPDAAAPVPQPRIEWRASWCGPRGRRTRPVPGRGARGLRSGARSPTPTTHPGSSSPSPGYERSGDPLQSGPTSAHRVQLRLLVAPWQAAALRKPSRDTVRARRGAPRRTTGCPNHGVARTCPATRSSIREPRPADSCAATEAENRSHPTGRAALLLPLSLPRLSLPGRGAWLPEVADCRPGLHDRPGSGPGTRHGRDGCRCRSRGPALTAVRLGSTGRVSPARRWGPRSLRADRRPGSILALSRTRCHRRERGAGYCTLTFRPSGRRAVLPARTLLRLPGNSARSLACCPRAGSCWPGPPPPTTRSRPTPLLFTG